MKKSSMECPNHEISQVWKISNLKYANMNHATREISQAWNISSMKCGEHKYLNREVSQPYSGVKEKVWESKKSPDIVHPVSNIAPNMFTVWREHGLWKNPLVTQINPNWAHRQATIVLSRWIQMNHQMDSQLEVKLTVTQSLQTWTDLMLGKCNYKHVDRWTVRRMNRQRWGEPLAR